MNYQDSILFSTKPSICYKREDNYLLVWGETGRWIVVDEDLYLLIKAFENGSKIYDALTVMCRKEACVKADIISEVKPVIGHLIESRILCTTLAKSPPFDEPETIANITYNITNNCNLNCPWCYNLKTDNEEIEPEEVIRWISKNREMLDKDVSFMILGGEPFLKQDRLAKIIRGIRPYINSEILVSTNGTLLKDETVVALKETQTTVQVSLDSFSEKVHDNIRGKGVFEKAISTARSLVENNIHTVFSMTMRNGFESELQPYFDLAVSNNIDEVRFIPLRQIGKCKGCSEIPDLLDFYKSLSRILKEYPGYRSLLHRDFFTILSNVCTYSSMRNNCGIARRVVFIDSDGSIYPCPNTRDRKYFCGNIDEVSLSRVMQKSSVMKMLREKLCVDKFSICSKCAVRYWCAGDCRAEAFSVYGNIDSPSPYCSQLKQIIINTFWDLSEGYDMGPSYRGTVYSC